MKLVCQFVPQVQRLPLTALAPPVGLLVLSDQQGIGVPARGHGQYGLPDEQVAGGVLVLVAVEGARRSAQGVPPPQVLEALFRNRDLGRGSLSFTPAS